MENHSKNLKKELEQEHKTNQSTSDPQPEHLQKFLEELLN